MKSAGLCPCGKALFEVTDSNGKRVGTQHLGEDVFHHTRVLGKPHNGMPHGEPDVSATDLCVCGHIRGSHMDWETTMDCLGGPDHSPCPCDAFHDVKA